MSIRLKLTLWYSTLLGITLLILGVGIYTFVNYNTYRDVKEQLQAGSKQVQVYAVGGDASNLQFALSSGPIERNVYLQVIDYVNGGLHQSYNLREGKLQLPYPAKSDNVTTGFVSMNVGNYKFLTYQVPVKLDGQVVALIQSAAYTGREQKYLYDLRTILIFSSVGVVLLTFTTGLFIARQALRPLKGIIQAANRVQDGSNLSVRIERGKPNDELGRLTDTLNGMLARIETTYNELDEAYNAQRRFVSDASHELRTPLTTIRGNIELLEKMWMPALESAGAKETNALATLTSQHAELTREAMLDIADESKRMSRLVNDLLSLARADAGQVMEKEVQPLQPLVEDVARRAQMLPRTAEWRIGDLSPLDDVLVHANADYIRQLFFIFVENAFKYTPSGHVELYAVKAADQAGVVIRDTGIGMNSSEIPHIFDRFYRADESRGKTSGTGLGLSIAKWIIDEHGGSVEVSTREGEGTTFIVWLPVAFLDKPIQV